MSAHEVWLDGQRVRLRPADLLQSGGEGLVFAHGQQALKRYHYPAPEQAARLAIWFSRRRPRVPANILYPEQPLHDAHGQLLGFAMRRLPADALPASKLSLNGFCTQQGLTIEDAAQIMDDARRTLLKLHAAGLVVGDLNDRNLFFSRSAGRWRSWWIDVDSFQVDQQPCPVALLPFLDPQLYHVQDFASRPWFSPATDWYAFHVLLHKALLQVHPYGGTHPQYKTLQSRALARLPVTAPGIVYPPNARPAALLHGNLRQQMTRVFSAGERPALPAEMLAHFLDGLQACPACGATALVGQACPTCTAPSRQARVVQRDGLQVRPLLLLDQEQLVAVDVDPATGRWRAVLFQPAGGGRYALAEGGRGGCRERRPLVAGGAGYSFQFTAQELLIMPPDGTEAQILILDLQDGGTIAITSSCRFERQAVVATTRSALYRQAGGYLLRGTVANQRLREAIAADARRQQTALGPASATQVAGYYRLFDAFHAFTIGDDGARHDLTLPPPPPDRRLTRVTLLRSNDGPTLLLTYRHRGQSEQVAALYDRQGRLNHTFGVSLTEPEAATRRGQTLFAPAAAGLTRWDASGITRYAALAADVAGGALYPTPDGLLAAHPDRLLLISA